MVTCIGHKYPKLPLCYDCPYASHTESSCIAYEAISVEGTLVGDDVEGDVNYVRGTQI